MASYIIKRILLIIPTVIGIMIINFVIVQAAPGGPIQQMISEMSNMDVSATSRISDAGGDFESGSQSDSSQKDISDKYYGAQGLSRELIERLEKMYGFDKPAHERFLLMMWNYLRFDFDESFFRNKTVLELIFEKLPVSVSLGLWTIIIIYLVSIPLGIRKAVKHGTPFDTWTSVAISIGNAIPAFLFAILLIVLFSGGGIIKIFPLRGLVSDNWETLSWPMKILDYFWHLFLPVVAMVIGGFTGLTLLTKNSFMEEIRKQYVVTARAKGVTENNILYRHIFRNAMLIVIAGFPAALLGILFTSNLLIEVIFSLDGLGLLLYESLMKRDYPVTFGSLYFFSLFGLLLKIVNDIMYVIVDPRIDFENR